jgi:hypothetical protein
MQIGERNFGDACTEEKADSRWMKRERGRDGGRERDNMSGG